MSDKNITNTYKYQFEKEKEFPEKSNDHGIKSTINLVKCITENQVEELNNILENEIIPKMTLNSCLQKALEIYRNNGDMIDIIDSLLK
jgi:hypothetical protein